MREESATEKVVRLVADLTDKEAKSLVEALAAAGISAQAAGDFLGQAPGQPKPTTMAVWVRQSELTKAKGVVAKLRPAPEPRT